ncbi:unnamed protein product [Trypanosoma congolense IL3000]|uniref:WGS project CAEQ00000000 data, annotated contig 1575 n=1 Tax=Trypanosoma congolense (strain IL3000) TaxID=1068625 RepID=F9W769_TRYCI|nr:unnamed protein product [Trypanosoma congolense IL3000]
MALHPRGELYAMGPERAREYGFVSYYNHTGNETLDRLTNNITLTTEEWLQLVTSPVQFILKSGGWGGLGIDATVLSQLFPCLLWTIVFAGLRFFAQKQLSRLGLWLQVVVPRHGDKNNMTTSQRLKLKKFQNQLWLTVYYTASTIFGYVILRDKPWFGLPVSESNRIALLTPHPYKPEVELLRYYRYGLGFYIAEMAALVVEIDIKRSDFFEYFIHHVVTLLLIIISHCSYEHRFGVYVLFIHDASDILLALGKVINYVVKGDGNRMRNRKAGKSKNAAANAPVSRLYKAIFNDSMLTACFLMFTVLFFFFRLLCLPFLALANIVYGVKIRMFTWSFTFLIFLLQVALQGLHVYWFTLILKIIASTITGKSVEDIRSEDDDDDDDGGGEALPKKSKRKEK